jgi:hypothetical protein
MPTIAASSITRHPSLTGVPPVRRVDTDEARKNAQLSIKKINKDFEAERTRLAGDRKRGNDRRFSHRPIPPA